MCKSVSGPIFGLCWGIFIDFPSDYRFCTIPNSTKRFQVDDSRGQSRWYQIYFRPLSWTIDYLSSETFQWRCFLSVEQCAWSHWTVGDYRWEDLFTMFCYFAPVTRHSFQGMCTVFSRNYFSNKLFDGLLRICTRKTNAEPRCLTSPWWSDLDLGSETPNWPTYIS